MPDSSPVSFDLTYCVRPAFPQAHLFAVEIVIPRPPNGPLVLSLPAWIPGSYMIRDFARNLLDVRVINAAGQSLPLVKCDKQTWICEGATRIWTALMPISMGRACCWLYKDWKTVPAASICCHQTMTSVRTGVSPPVCVHWRPGRSVSGRIRPRITPASSIIRSRWAVSDWCRSRWAVSRIGLPSAAGTDSTSRV